MDIKSKNNKKTKKYAVVIVLLAAILYTSLYPYFERSADKYISSSGVNEFEKPEFLRLLLQSNFVLYKDVMDKGSDKKHSYLELFTEQEYKAAKYDAGDIEGEEALYDYEGKISKLYYGQMENYLEIYGEQLQEKMSAIRNGFFSAIGKRMDYCIIEKDTGAVIKNTSQEIEQLLSEGEGWENPYAYYIVLDYGSNGNLGNINVRSTNADNLLKTIQLLAGGEDNRLLEERSSFERYVLYDEEENTKGYLTVSQKNPSNVTIAYAMTKEQMNMFFDEKAYGETYYSNQISDYYYTLEREGIWYTVGVHNVYLLFLLGIFLLVLFLEKKKPTAVSYEEAKKYPIEVILAAGIIMIGTTITMVVGIVNYSDQDLFAQWINDRLPISIYAGSASYMLLEKVINVAFLMLFFGIWYWCCLCVKDIVNGIVIFFKERSLLYKYWRQIIEFFQNLYRKFKEEIYHVNLSGNMDRTLKKILIINFVVLAIISCFWVFGIFLLVFYSAALYLFSKKYIIRMQEQYSKLLKATNSIAAGNLNNTFEEDFGIFESYKEKLYEIQDGFSKAVEEEVKSQKMKTELITNVSHDLKTPLTAIITYIDLLKTEHITEEQRKEYIATLERKSIRLKVLIEDLFEVSKANSRNVKLEPVPVDICNLLRQVYLEYEEKLREQSLDMRFRLPEEKMVLLLDSQKTYRIFENLYVNISKYAMPGTRVYVVLERRGEDGVWIEMKNISAQEIHVKPDELTERFVRGDAARNTEGSGLGLAIAKSFVELQGGRFFVETDGDLFKVVIELKTSFKS